MLTHRKRNHSFWPGGLQPVLRDEYFSKQSDNTHLSFMVPGYYLEVDGSKVKREPKSLHGMFNRLTDEFLEGHRVGFACTDYRLAPATPGRVFRSPCVLLTVTTDWPGGAKVSECTSSGFHGCRYCLLKGATSAVCRTTVYPGARR